MSREEQSKEAMLPQLRDDLRLMPAETLPSGAPSWLLFDPLRNAYHRLDRLAYERIAAWQPIGVSDYLTRINSNANTQTSEDELKEFVKFLYAQKLTISPPGGDIETFAAQEFAATPPLSHTLIHKYLFFRIPLLQPDRFLQKVYPLIQFLFSRPAIWTVIIMGALGLYFTGRQWEAFIGTFMHFLTFEGLIYYGLTLAGLKVIHELGHAFTAHHFGSRVPVMGLAFLVMFPILYTDTTNAWELTDRRKRVLIDAAGMLAELMIACIAIFLWSFLPDGPLRSAAFFAATTSWILSLLVNLNPMMRFDGYYLLTDLFGVPNMQADGFETGRWHMRETLFGLGTPPPPNMGSTRRRGLIIYAYSTWVYRFFLFIGIALLVHALFPRAIGIVLFSVEIGWFIVLPIVKELKHWWSLRMSILKSARGRLTSLLVLTGLIAMIAPWQTTITAPALLRPSQQTELYPAFAAQVKSVNVREGQSVSKGDIIAVLSSDNITMEIEIAQHKLSLVNAQLSRRAADRRDLSDSAVLLQSKLREQKRVEGLLALQQSLILRAPHSGIVTDLPTDLHLSRYVPRDYRIARLVSDRDFEIVAYPMEQQASRLSGQTQARFIPDDVTQKSLKTKVTALAPTSLSALGDDVLSSAYRGPIAVAENDQGQAIALTAVFKLAAAPAQNLSRVPREITGVLKIKAARQSPVQGVMKSVSRVLIRETDF